MSSWVAQRQSILVSVFLAYLVHKLNNKQSQILVYNILLENQNIKEHHKEQDNAIKKYSYLDLLVMIQITFIVVGLISSNLLQSGIFEAILAWVILISLCVVHFANFKQIQAKKRGITHLIFYLLVTASPIVAAIHYIIP